MASRDYLGGLCERINQLATWAYARLGRGNQRTERKNPTISLHPEPHSLFPEVPFEHKPHRLPILDSPAKKGILSSNLVTEIPVKSTPPRVRTLEQESDYEEELYFSISAQESSMGPRLELPRTAKAQESSQEDARRFVTAVKNINTKDLLDFERLYINNKEAMLINPMLFVAAFGTPEVVAIVQKWEGLNVDEECNIPLLLRDVFERMPFTNVSPLSLATSLNRKETAESIIKYSGEKCILSCLAETKISDIMEKILMNELAERLKVKYTDLKPAVIPGHRKNNDGTKVRVFIVYSKEVAREEEYCMNGIAVVLIRNPYYVRKMVGMSTESTSGIFQTLSKADIERAQKAIESHSKILWEKHSNLNIIKVSPHKYQRNTTLPLEKVCIALYCSTKGFIPLGEPDFPTKLNVGTEEYIDVDVCEGYFQYSRYDTLPSTSRHEKLKMGCEIGQVLYASGNIVPVGGGTLGPFVNFNGCIGFLTCAHVFFGAGPVQTPTDYTYNGPNRIDVVQPSTDCTTPCGNPCGFVQRAIFDPNMDPSIDVAVVQISDRARVPDKGRFANKSISKVERAGFDDLPEYNSGSILVDLTKKCSSQMFVKFGSETHLTKGYMAVLGTQVRPLTTDLTLPLSTSNIVVKGQYEIIGHCCSPDFFRLGDSGSAVFAMDPAGGLHCIGMAIGCIKGDTGYLNAVVTPIGAILNVLGPHCDLHRFM